MIKNKIIFGLAAILLLGSGSRPQAPVLYYYETIPAGGTVANCPAVASGVTAWCTVATGKFQSINGGAWTSMTAGGASLVTSVNGKTGAVTIAATTTIQ